ncbi:MAG: mechanosensitive ion channel [Gemmataceae bacterium]
MPALPRFRSLSLALCLACLALPDAAPAQAPIADVVKKSEAPKGKDGGSAESRILNADRISRLQLTMQQDRELRDKLKIALDKVNESIRAISGDLAAMDGKLRAKGKQRDALDPKTEEAVILGGEMKDLALQAEIAKEQLDLTIKERKLVQERLAGVDQKLLQNQIALDVLLNDDGKKPGESGSDPVLKKAREDAKLREEKAKEAENATKSLEQRIRAISDFVGLEKGLLENDKKKLELALAQEKALAEERQQKLTKGATPEEIAALNAKIDAQHKRGDEIRASIAERNERVTRLERDLTALRSEKTLADQEVAAKKAEAERAGADVKRLENPFNPQNMLRWLVEHGPRMFLVLVGMFALFIIVRSLDKRLVNFMARRGPKGTAEERENRARTLAGVFHNFGMLLVWAGGALMMLEEMGIPVIPLMGGAAILGLAVAFGAQNLIKDYFYGFVILLENQYMVNDVVKIGDVSGSVERITLRMTVLRDIEGVVHFIPHGQVTSVSNQTHGWSQALFEIGVAYKEDVDRVMEVLLSVGRTLRRDPLWEDMITEDPEMLGVDQFSDSAVTIKFVMKTKPLQQWKVKREMMRRIKNTFDELKISMPFPQRVVHHQYGEDGAAPVGKAA